MRFSPNENAHNVAPPNLRCIWMTAGILSYQLCDRQFDCDQCPLDAAMRMHFSRHDETDKPREERRLHSELSYSRNHCWIRYVSGNLVRVGFEPDFAKAVRSARAVVLPAAGDRLRHDEWCLWIVIDSGTLPIRAPFTGTIESVNLALADEPNLISDSPYDLGWLFEATVKDDEKVRSHFLTTGEAGALYAHDHEHFQKLLSAALSGPETPVGETLYDGGEIIRDPKAMVGEKRYIALLREVYCR